MLNKAKETAYAKGSSRATAALQAADAWLPNRSADEPLSPGARMLAVLEAVSGSQEPVSASDLTPQLALPRATVHRLCLSLERMGFLQREPGTRQFVAGHRQQRMAVNSLVNSFRRGERHAVLQALARDVGETVNVTVLDGNEALYIDRVECQWPLRTHLQAGSRVPIHCGASGKLYLSMLPAGKRRRLLVAPLQRFTSKTITDIGALEKHLKQIRASKVSIDNEEFMQGLIGLAVPVYCGGRICATVSLHAPTARHTVESVRSLVPTLQRSAEAISALLAMPGSDR